MRMKTLGLLLAPLLVLGIACDEQTAIAPEDASFAKNNTKSDYDAIVLDGGNGNARAINDAGIAVGVGRELRGGGPYPALRWVVTSEGVAGPEELPLLDGVSFHQPVAVNSSGMIAGYFQKDNGWGALVYSDELQMQALPQFASTDESFAWDINDLSIVVGSITTGILDDEGSESRLTRAAVWFNAVDEPTLLPALEGHVGTRAVAINTSGLIPGSSHPVEGPSVGVTWLIGEAGELPQGPYELPAGFSPSAVNAEGDIVGAYGECGSALMRGDQLIVLDPDETCHKPTDITDAAADGTVQIISGLWFEGAVLWTVDAGGQVSGPVDLGSPKGTKGAYTSGINAQGWIVGAGRTERGDVPALWLPKTSGDGGGDGGGDCTHPRGKC